MSIPVFVGTDYKNWKENQWDSKQTEQDKRRKISKLTRGKRRERSAGKRRWQTEVERTGMFVQF